MGFDLYETLLQTQHLSDVLKFAAERTQRHDAEEPECAASSAPTHRVPYSPAERGTDSIPISFSDVA